MSFCDLFDRRENASHAGKISEKGGGPGSRTGPQRLILVSISQFARFVYINFSHFLSAGKNLSVDFPENRDILRAFTGKQYL